MTPTAFTDTITRRVKICIAAVRLSISEFHEESSLIRLLHAISISIYYSPEETSEGFVTYISPQAITSGPIDLTRLYTALIRRCSQYHPRHRTRKLRIRSASFTPRPPPTFCKRLEGIN